MMPFPKKLGADVKGMSLVEFALIAPALFTFIIGIAQLGLLFLANAGLKAAVGEGARDATIWPKPSDAKIVEVITSRRFGLEPEFIKAPTVTSCVSGGRKCIDIQMAYARP